MNEPIDIGIRELTQELGKGFSRRGWEDPESLAFEIAQAARRTGSLDPKAASALANKVFLERNQIEPEELQALIEEVFAGRSLIDAERDHPPVIENHISTFEIKGDNNYVDQVNVGGRQTILTTETAKDEVLDAIRLFVQEGIGDLDPDELASLDRLVSSRSDLDLSEVESATREGIQGAKPDSGRLKRMRETVMSSTASGLLVQAIIAVIGTLV